MLLRDYVPPIGLLPVSSFGRNAKKYYDKKEPVEGTEPDDDESAKPRKRKTQNEDSGKSKKDKKDKKEKKAKK